MHYVYDFDSTLFGTQRLWEVWRGMLVAVGHEPDAVDATYRSVVADGYSPRRHAAALGVTDAGLDGLVARFNAVMSDESPSLLFDDVAPFVEARRHASRQTILTQGDRAHQWEKIRASGIDRLLPDVRVAPCGAPKTQSLAGLLDQDPRPMTFVDDNPYHLVAAHESGLPIRLVRMMRPSETLAIGPHELDGVAWRVVRSLDEL
jgi:FMN phosphatase YigB (HAD superfamily)